MPTEVGQSLPMQDIISDAVRAAVKDASNRGWEATILVLVLLGLIVLTGTIVKWLIRSMDKRMEEANAREERLGAAIDSGQKFEQTTLLKVVEDTSRLATQVIDTIRSLKGVLERKPCLLSPEMQDDLVDRVAFGIVNRSTIYPPQKHSEKKDNVPDQSTDDRVPGVQGSSEDDGGL